MLSLKFRFNTLIIMDLEVEYECYICEIFNIGRNLLHFLTELDIVNEPELI